MVWNYLPYVDPFRYARLHLYCYCAIDMDLGNIIGSTCSTTQFCGFVQLLKYLLIWCIVESLCLFAFYLHKFSFTRCSLLVISACQLDIRGTFKNISWLKTKAPGLEPKVVWTLLLIECMIIDRALSMSSSAYSIVLGASRPCNNVRSTLPIVWCICLQKRIAWGL